MLETQGRGEDLELLILQESEGWILQGDASEILEEEKQKKLIDDLSEIQGEVLEEVKSRVPKETTSSDIKKSLKVQDRTALRALKALEKKGLLISKKRSTDKGTERFFKLSPASVLRAGLSEVTEVTDP